MKGLILPFRIILLSAWIVMATAAMVFSEQLYVDGLNGSDDNHGTKTKPVRTISCAAEIVDNANKTGSATIRIGPGIYTIEKTIVFSKRNFSKDKRLSIKATILPDDPDWKPGLMPVIVSAEIPKPTESGGRTAGKKTTSCPPRWSSSASSLLHRAEGICGPALSLLSI